jgi:hypothetical protein
MHNRSCKLESEQRASLSVNFDGILSESQGQWSKDEMNNGRFFEADRDLS